MQVKLNNRLHAVAGFVLPGKTAADIGADHNYLPVYLIINGICPYVVAVERATGPYENACQLVDLLSLSRQIDVRFGDGLAPLQPGEAATVTIAGMGGFLIQDILSCQPAVVAQTERLVLQPQKNSAAVRRWLMDNGWRIVAEQLALDNGFYYEIIAAEHGEMSLDEDELTFGPCLLAEPHPLLADFLQLKRKDLSSLTEQVSAMTGANAAQRLRQLQSAIAQIDRILRRCER
ncbi:MAG: class I SAM-dependent methyltransferase [Firmicutes bacterium]|nr:class I SAM-dependent methyltransferase [Bacillota bacterium]